MPRAADRVFERVCFAPGPGRIRRGCARGGRGGTAARGPPSGLLSRQERRQGSVRRGLQRRDKARRVEGETWERRAGGPVRGRRKGMRRSSRHTCEENSKKKGTPMKENKRESLTTRRRQRRADSEAEVCVWGVCVCGEGAPEPAHFKQPPWSLMLWRQTRTQVNDRERTQTSGFARPSLLLFAADHGAKAHHINLLKDHTAAIQAPRPPSSATYGYTHTIVSGCARFRAKEGGGGRRRCDQPNR